MRNTCLDESGLSHRLNRKNYDDLRTTDVLVPRLLMVVVVPNEIGGWLSQSDDGAMIKYCTYWTSLRGLPNTTQETISVLIPQVNRVTPEGLNELMQKIALGDVL
jgi:hypothetical protein